MAAIVNIGGFQFGGSSNGVGVFSGQNMQNAWDANSPNTSNYGTQMGQMSAQYAVWAVLNDWMWIGQPVLDNDIKNNGAPMLEGP
ncbi:hypothetical protein JI721_09235 [Alicyclobacillus cycloheptanicus]|jgi:hypothetical protein|uniref:Uncharacterized protein n=1 Tax=Alicyclobacillus cycloheptanicus TaxID=1457 RepID=A0ABT9XH75_9BACL|nr:hypothetical protein [Alicyclobacillus cycloheptanicus]MDQ0189656.1 hypothetical protein [Alicyclobacillus cycloheptanicus]WDL99956.1 hypothetical protein JI721_09235 [Alicyclobacillus cycloheptanicus]